MLAAEEKLDTGLIWGRDLMSNVVSPSVLILKRVSYPISATGDGWGGGLKALDMAQDLL